MPLPRALGFYSYSPVIDCEYKPCYNDTVCCSATKPFKDKYCEEQKIWREINCCKPRKKSCCSKWDKTEELCSRFRNTPNWNCVQDRNYKENNKTMQALSTCCRRSCITRDCSGPYYSMKGPVNHPPGLICQDYSLYIPTERILEHCKCKGNHHCKRLKRLPGRCFPCASCCIPIGDDCCYQCNPNQNSMPNYQCQTQMPCNTNTGLTADIQNYCCQNPPAQNQEQCCEDGANFPNYDLCCQQNQDNNTNMVGNTPTPCPDDCDNAVQCNRPSGPNEMDKLLEEFKYKWNHSESKTGRRNNRNPILGIDTEPKLQIQLLQKDNNNDCSGDETGTMVCTQQPDCDCAACRRQEIRLNGNHYSNCTCGICQRRRGCGGFVAPKITDRKADRCRKLWFDNQRDPCPVDPDNSDKAVQNITNMNSDATTMECTNSIDCTCPACCRKRQYARIKPYNCYANGLTNPAIELKKMYFIGDENNNASGDKEKLGKNSKTKSPRSGSDTTTVSKSTGSTSITSPSGETTQSNSVTTYGNTTPTSDKSNNNISGQDSTNSQEQPQQENQQNKINVDETKINYEDTDVTNVEYYTGDCKRENPCRKSFGLDVTYRQLSENKCSNGDCNNCSWGCCPNECCNNFNQSLCPCDPYQNQQYPCDCYETSLSNYPYVCPPPPCCRIRRRRQRCIPAPTAMDDNCAADSVDGDGCNGECDPNDYNTTVYRESFKRVRPRARCGRTSGGSFSYDPNRKNFDDVNNPNCDGDFPPDDDGWCNGKPRYRRGRTFDQGCQNYLLRSDTFSIFDNMFKPTAGSACKQCEEECLQRTCHDRQCRMPNSMELRKIRWPVEDDGVPTCCCQCGMLDRYCNTCDQTI